MDDIVQVIDTWSRVFENELWKVWIGFWQTCRKNAGSWMHEISRERTGLSCP